MSRQHATPLIVPAVGDAAPLAALGPEAHGWSEAAVQSLVQAHPACLPIREIDPLFADPVPLCTEMNTGAGPIDNVMITPSGLPVLVECKLWRNPQARREVVGQILDYAKELSRWTASDLQREVSRQTGRTVVDIVRDKRPDLDEVGFTDAVTLNLRRGRFLLLIVGDGIREGVEAIAEYLQGQAGLQFTLGLVEMPIFAMPDGARLVAPRVLARTASISREVIVVPEGMALREQEAAEPEAESQLTDDESSRRELMLEVAAGLQLDDPDQPTPRVSPKGWLYLYLPAPASSCWISVLDKRSSRQVGVRLTSNVNTVGEAAIRLALQDWDAVKAELGGGSVREEMSEGRFRVEELLTVSREASATERERAVLWLRGRIRDYVSTFRPRIRDAVDQLKEA